MLEVSSLNAGYGRVKVLDDVSLTIKRGEMVALLGANNAGKSTLIHCLSGLVPPTGGSMSLDGKDRRCLTAAGLMRRATGRMRPDPPRHSSNGARVPGSSPSNSPSASSSPIRIS